MLIGLGEVEYSYIASIAGWGVGERVLSYNAGENVKHYSLWESNLAISIKTKYVHASNILIRTHPIEVKALCIKT